MAKRANQLSGSDWLKNSFSIWRGFSRDKDAKEHPAPFPVSLASRLIDCFAADPDGIVLDPFVGSGSTLLAAMNAGMSGIGFDLNPEYQAMFEKRVSLLDNGKNWKYWVHDAREMSRFVNPESVEICITSPPYWDILNRSRSADKKKNESYSEDSNDLGNITEYEDFLESLTDVIVEVERTLRQGGYCIVNVMDIRKKSEFFPLHQDVVDYVSKNTAFRLEDIIIWDRQADYNSMRPLGYPYKFVINKVHEYLLIFRKNGKLNERESQNGKKRKS